MPPVDAQAPIEMAHLGCGICCQMRRNTGASLNGTRPAQMRTSACRGEKLMRSMPKRARSNLLAAVAMNSMAQHAVPNGIGHRQIPPAPVHGEFDFLGAPAPRDDGLFSPPVSRRRL